MTINNSDSEINYDKEIDTYMKTYENKYGNLSYDNYIKHKNRFDKIMKS